MPSLDILRTQYAKHERFEVRGDRPSTDVTSVVGQIEGYGKIALNWRIVEAETGATVVAFGGGGTKHISHYVCDKMNELDSETLPVRRVFGYEVVEFPAFDVTALVQVEPWAAGYKTVLLDRKIIDLSTGATYVVVAGSNSQNVAEFVAGELDRNSKLVYEKSMSDLQNNSEVRSALDNIEVNIEKLRKQIADRGLTIPECVQDVRSIFRQYDELLENKEVRAGSIMFLAIQLKDRVKDVN